MFDLFKKIALITANTIVKKILDIPRQQLASATVVNVYENGDIKFGRLSDCEASIIVDISWWDGQNIAKLRAVVYDSIIGEEPELREMTEKEVEIFSHV